LRWTIWLITFTGVVYVCGYAFDVRTRLTRLERCQWTLVSSPDARPYIARYCLLDKETALLRLYDAKGQRVLAERMFFELDRPNFYWKDDALGYSTPPDGGVISLPPTVLDRLRAKLP
jgi:hypothetical protein